MKVTVILDEMQTFQIQSVLGGKNVSTECQSKYLAKSLSNVLSNKTRKY